MSYDYDVQLPVFPEALPGQQYWLIVQATGPRDRVAEQSGPAPVAQYDFRVEQLEDADEIEAPRTVGHPQQTYALPSGLSDGQLQRLLALLADSRMLETVFADQVEAGTHRAKVMDEAAAAKAAQWIAQAGAALVGGEEEPQLPAGWAMWFSVNGYVPYSSERWLRSDAQRGTVPNLTGTARGALAWPQGRPEGAVAWRPEVFLERLQAFGLEPPIPRRHVAAAAWRAGFVNIRALSALLGPDRKTLYAHLRAAGIEPTDRTR
ncbi:MAG TPA: hypothetical protein VN520_35360 [Streptomyces sp.]|uniref:hypothetical protein n=1 Tax=Streptomyces sp. TaxID=1931 RepID=UPI002C18CFDB|nr:hypothetical protein [Streptomyces sp.]HWU11575.1 hypothetical protein [Streptomyces sp.]